MSHPGFDSSSGEAVPSSSSESSRRDEGSEFTVPATPPVASARAGSDAAPSTMHNGITTNGSPSTSLRPGPSPATLGNSMAAVSITPSHPSSQTTIPGSPDAPATGAGTSDKRPAPEPRTNGSPGTWGGADSAGRQRLRPLSATAAALERSDQDAAAAVSSRKRMANGQVKTRSGSNSPVKGHARSVSAISTTSTGSHIGDMSADLKTRLAYAMVKVNNGWQSRSLDEVESLASRAASPVSSNSTLHRRQSSSSPRPAPTSAAQVQFAPDPAVARRKSNSPPGRGKPTLAPPAPIQPSLSRQHANTRRTPVPRHHPPALLTHSHSASAAHYSQRHHLDAAALSSRQPLRPPPDSFPYSPHQNVREQDAIETLLFMSSPGNSANLKHTFSPSVSPAPPQQQPQQGPMHGTAMNRNASSNGYRKGLPGQRPAAAAAPQRRVGFNKSPAMGPPGSPMDLDSPRQLQPDRSPPSTWTAKRRANGASGHLRGALSLPSGLGVGSGRPRPTLRDEDIDRLIDQALSDSSDNEEIQLPARTNGIAPAVGM